MPIYEYRCDSCRHEFETIQKLSEDPLQTCPECEQNALVKKVSAAGFRLKGSGWYETDFKSGNQRNVWGDRDSAGDDSGGSKEGAKKSSESSNTSGTSGDSGSNVGSSKSSEGGSSSSTKQSD